MDGFTSAPARRQAALETLPFHRWTMPDGSCWTEFHRVADGYLLRFPGLADFEVSADGGAVTGIPAPATSAATLQHLYLNQVLPLALSRRGGLVFHASAVEVSGGAVAFIGASGRGKSTLAAALAVAGCRVLTDDGLVLQQTAGCVEVLPSHPSIRLWEDSQEALVDAQAPRAPALEFTTKARFLAGGDFSFCDQPRVLTRAYFLGEGTAEQVRIEAMTATEALAGWMSHVFLLDVEDRSILASQFHQVSQLARSPVHFRLDYPRRFDDLAALREAVLEHASAEAAQA